MSVHDAPDVEMDRLLIDWLEADAAARAPESLETAFVEGVASTRQRPAWATTERWISMDTRAQLGILPRAAVIFLAIALLTVALAASLALAGNLTRADDGGGATDGLTYFTPDGVIYTYTTKGDDPVRLTDEDERASAIAWSPDGTRFSYDSWNEQDGRATIMVRDADGSNPVAVSQPFEVARGNAARRYHAWSPDGSTILHWAGRPDIPEGSSRCTNPGAFCGQRIWAVTSDGSELARMIGDPELDAQAPVWTPDGERIIFAGSPGGGTDYGLYRMDADGANVERIGDLTGDGTTYDRLAISPDGTTAAVSSGLGVHDLYLVDLATGEEVLIAGEEADEFGPYWSPGGSELAFTSWARSPTADPQAMIYDIVSSELISLDMPIYVLGWSPDGRSIITDWPDGILTMVDVSDPTAPAATEVEGAIKAYMPSWRPRP